MGKHFPEEAPERFCVAPRVMMTVRREHRFEEGAVIEAVTAGAALSISQLANQCPLHPVPSLPVLSHRISQGSQLSRRAEGKQEPMWGRSSTPRGSPVPRGKGSGAPRRTELKQEEKENVTQTCFKVMAGFHSSLWIK